MGRHRGEERTLLAVDNGAVRAERRQHAAPADGGIRDEAQPPAQLRDIRGGLHERHGVQLQQGGAYRTRGSRPRGLSPR